MRKAFAVSMSNLPYVLWYTSAAHRVVWSVSSIVSGRTRECKIREPLG